MAGTGAYFLLQPASHFSIGQEPSGQTGQHVLHAIKITVEVTNTATPIKIIFFIVNFLNV
jgi:hypothetical protein